MTAICKSRKATAVAAALLTLLMLISLWAVPTFAAETTADTSVTESASATETTAPETTGAASDTTASTTTSTDTSASTTAAETKKPETTNNKAEEAAKKDRMTRGIINLSVGVIILIVAAILVFKFRAKIPGWWKALKSECGKIVWCPKDKLKKNTLVVVIIILAIGIVIGILDFVFSDGIILLRKIFQ